MAIVTSDFLTATYQGFRALYQQAYNEYQPDWADLALEIDSTTSEEIHNWLGSVPAMREWTDEKIPKGLYAHNYTIVNKDWESTLDVDRNTLEDDKLGLIRPRIQELGIEAKRHPGRLIYQLVRDNGLCYDGQNFFDTDHSEGASGAQSNSLTGTGTTLAQMQVDLGSAIAAMAAFKDDQGEPFGNIVPDTAMCPPTGILLYNLLELMNATVISQTTNVLGKYIKKLLVNPWLTDTNDWMLFDTTHGVKPFLYQLRKPPAFVALTNPNATESVFLRKKYLYGVESRDNAGYGMWQYALRITNT